MRRPKRPAVGDRVEVVWLDSGLDFRDAPAKRASLHVSTCWGRVTAIEEDDRLPRGVDRTTLWILVDSAGEDDDGSRQSAIWWPAVLACRRLVVK